MSFGSSENQPPALLLCGHHIGVEQKCFACSEEKLCCCKGSVPLNPFPSSHLGFTACYHKKQLPFFCIKQGKIEMLCPARLFGGRRECDRERLMVSLG